VMTWPMTWAGGPGPGWRPQPRSHKTPYHLDDKSTSSRCVCACVHTLPKGVDQLYCSWFYI
jgi:hypothetical protein